MKILLAVDGSEYTQRMLDYVAAHKDDLGATNSFTVFNAVLAVPPHAASFVSRATLHVYYEQEARQVIDPIRDFFKDKGIEAEYRHQAGQPAEQICSVAQEGGVDLLMMGSHGHGALSNLVLGSVATQVLARCSVPVLLVR